MKYQIFLSISIVVILVFAFNQISFAEEGPRTPAEKLAEWQVDQETRRAAEKVMDDPNADPEIKEVARETHKKIVTDMILNDKMTPANVMKVE